MLQHDELYSLLLLRSKSRAEASAVASQPGGIGAPLDELIQECIGAIDGQELKVSRATKEYVDSRGVTQKSRRDRGTSLVEYSLLANFSDDLKSRLLTAVRSTDTGDFAVGAFVGLAVGDWVGAPLEFCEVTDAPGASRWNPDTFSYSEPRQEGERGQLKLGQFTDDTSMAICLADSLIIHRRLVGSDARIRFWNWHAEGLNNCFRFDEGRMLPKTEGPQRTSFGLGYNISKSLLDLAAGATPPDVFESPGCNDSGNGGLMRLAPVPVFFASRAVDEAMDAGGRSSQTTHPGPLATESARCMSFLVHRAINLPPEQRSCGARAFLETSCGEYAARLQQRISTPSEGDDTEALTELVDLMLSQKPKGSTEQNWNWKQAGLSIAATLALRGTTYNGHPVSAGYFGSYCMDALAIALHCVASTECFDGVLEKTVNFCGDADSIAAIACQIAGAFYGYGAINRRYVQELNTWDHGEIACRAALCFFLGSQPA